jgi:hypothetical protein
MLYRVHLSINGFELTTLVVIGTDCTYRYKSNDGPLVQRVWSLTNRLYHPSFWSVNYEHSCFNPSIVLSMFMLSFNFVIVCGLFECKQICTGFFYRLPICVLPLEIELWKGEDWNPIKRFIPATLVCLTQARTWISKDIWHGLFNCFDS